MVSRPAVSVVVVPAAAGWSGRLVEGRGGRLVVGRLEVLGAVADGRLGLGRLKAPSRPTGCTLVPGSCGRAEELRRRRLPAGAVGSVFGASGEGSLQRCGTVQHKRILGLLGQNSSFRWLKGVGLHHHRGWNDHLQ